MYFSGLSLAALYKPPLTTYPHYGYDIPLLRSLSFPHTYTHKHTVKIDFYVTAIKIDKNRLLKKIKTHTEIEQKKTQFRFDRKLFHGTLITSNSFQKHLKPIAELMENKFCCQQFCLCTLSSIRPLCTVMPHAIPHIHHRRRRRRRTAIYVFIQLSLHAVAARYTLPTWSGGL